MNEFKFITDPKQRQQIIDEAKDTVKKFPIKVFTMSGLATCGKTTFENFVDKRSSMYGVTVEITSAVKFVKQFVSAYCGWKGGKSDVERKFLSDIKDAFESYCDFNRINIAMEISLAASCGANAIFIDSREAGDMLWLKENFGAERIFISKASLSGTKHGNHADDNAENLDYDIYISNDGTLEELEEKATEFIKTHIVSN